VDDIKRLVGQRVRALRKEKGLTQEELGWRAELHYTYIGAVERGEKNCSIESLDKIVKALNVTIHDFFASFPLDLISSSSRLAGSERQSKNDKLVKEICQYSPDILKHILALIKSCQGQNS